MARLHLFEFFDLPSVPTFLKHCGVEYLAFIESKARGPVSALLPPIRKALEQAESDNTGKKPILDLCSGGAGPWPILSEQLTDVTVTLTDLRPNLPALDRASGNSSGQLQVRREPLDALAVPPELPGVRTIINGMHHFQPNQAKRLLASAVEAKQPVVVLEMLSRSAAHVITSPFIILFSLLLSLFIRPFRISRLVFTYLLPVLPLMIWWDGLVSGIRVYSEKELRALVSDVPDHQTFDWEIGSLKVGPATVPYLVGFPRG